MLPANTKVDTHKLRYNVVRNAMQRLKWILTKDDSEAHLVWWDGYIPLDAFNALLPYQRINKIPGMDILCYKNTFFQSLVHMKTLFPPYYNFFATTFQLPFQFTDFQREHLKLASKSTSPITWIVKPRSGCCGNGIKLIQNSFDVLHQTSQAIIQRYITPFLLDRFKFDFRFYILILTVQPFTVYLYNEGLCRFCTEPYVEPTRENLNDKYCHLTNTAVNVANKEAQNSILQLSSNVLKRIAAEDPRGATLWAKIKEVVLLSMVAQYPQILQSISTFSTSSSLPKPDPKPQPLHAQPIQSIDPMQKFFHICGIDIMLNNLCEPIVLELNDRPSMCVTYDIENNLKTQIVFDALQLVTLDGNPPPATVPTGGWQQILPITEESQLGKAVNIMLRQSTQNLTTRFPPRKVYMHQMYSHDKVATSPKKKPTTLPPLHQ